MTDHDDVRIDEALEALACPQPPADHVARVIARTAAQRGVAAGDSQDRPRLAYLRPRWVLPIAATVLVVLGATWQIDRQARHALDDSNTPDGARQLSRPATWHAREEVVQPVLPPQAYWGMDPFREFATLRPGTRVTAEGVSSADHVSSATAGQSRAVGRMVADDELTWESVPSGLPPIELVSIAPPPLVVPALAPLADTTLAEIPLAPIVIAPFDDQE